MAVWLAVSTQYTNVIETPASYPAHDSTGRANAWGHRTAEMAHIEGCIVLRLAKTYNVI